jgi:prophage regulatory protein
MANSTTSPRQRKVSTKPKAAIHATQSNPINAAAIQSVFDQLPDSAWLRESQLVRSPKRPNSTAPLPFSAPTLWRMVKAGAFPAPAKLSARVTAWKCSQVRQWMAEQTAA